MKARFDSLKSNSVNFIWVIIVDICCQFPSIPILLHIFLLFFQLYYFIFNKKCIDNISEQIRDRVVRSFKLSDLDDASARPSSQLPKSGVDERRESISRIFYRISGWNLIITHINNIWRLWIHLIAETLTVIFFSTQKWGSENNFKIAIKPAIKNSSMQPYYRFPNVILLQK